MTSSGPGSPGGAAAARPARNRTATATEMLSRLIVHLLERSATARPSYGRRRANLGWGGGPPALGGRGGGGAPAPTRRRSRSTDQEHPVGGVGRAVTLSCLP